MAKILKEPKILTDFNNDAACILPIGFDLTDDKWDKIWALHEKLNRFMGHQELLMYQRQHPSHLVSQHGLVLSLKP